jgi:DNA-binding response OmpR family regulator
METPTVLIVEDSSYLADSLVDMIDMQGYHSLHAATGEQGVALALEHQPDLILLDIRLPDINGYEVYRRVRATDWGATARVIVLTASESVENIAKNIDLPSEHVLFKPEWSIKQLLEKIAQRLAD